MSDQVTETDICNMALASCGARSTIASLRENSNEARQCLLFFNNTRDALLRAAQWNFSRKTAYLTLIKSAPGTPENPNGGSVNGGIWNPATMPALPWLYSYATPSDAVRVWSILPFAQTNWGASTPIFSVDTQVPPIFDWRRGARFIEALDTNNQGDQTTCLLTNQDQAVAVYGARVVIPGLWDPQFQTAMINSLAWRLTIPLSGDKALGKQCHDIAVEAITQARVTDGNVGSTTVNRIPDWLAIRGYAGDWSTVPTEAYCAGWVNPSFLGI